MPIQFRKASIKSRKRTLGLAGLGLILNTITSHPKVDVTAMVNVALMSRFAAAPLMASLGSLTRTGDSRSTDNAVTTPAASPNHVAWNCARARRADG
jgi:hypothetical protein